MKITVITVCLNSADTIEKAIKSVIEQRYHGLEYIVIDGGSTDGTLDILNRYDAYIDKRISEPDDGIFDAMNKGIELAEGDVIAFLNSDDWYEQNALQMVENAFMSGGCDCVCCDNYVLNKNGDTVYYNGTNKSFDDLYYRMIYFHSAVFCKKEFFRKKGNFDLKYKIAADYDWLLRAVEQGAIFRNISQPVFTFRYGGISSVNEIDCAKEARQIALCHLPADKEEYKNKIDDRFYGIAISALDKSILQAGLMEILNEERINILWGAGVRGKQCAKWFQDMDIKVAAIIDSDRKRWGEHLQGVEICAQDILEHQSCNLIITPDKHIEDIKNAVIGIAYGNVHVFELKSLCRKVIDNMSM
ncbi:MAG: glycosyltransferase [Lachnospiraceae bacterium]|nr:glycosyltransferase [Lachnospiraceae bacterium]